MSNGGNLRKHIPYEVDLIKQIAIDSPFTFDFSQQNIYKFLGKYIVKSRFSGTEELMYHFKKVKILSMEYDPTLRVIIFLNDRKQLRLLSLITHFQYKVSNNVTGFKYSPHHKLKPT
ncbi:hypothetical protein RF11_10923 [Thelohanellus kitauei]|uniref:Uncharacterized protein n=1 Tax=Thelohanellus kitauei TaxID=669202 RepID=A0A0C2MMR1_THEKT|nr:hypothetical protein RF11_10923 [Thelohanellus kitauei]